MSGAKKVTTPWTPEDLDHFHRSRELRISTVAPDGTSTASVPIWVVCAQGQVFVRSWYRRDSGWFGRAVRLRRAHVRAPGIEADVVVNDLGVGSPDVRAAVDEAYREKYRPAGAGSMVSNAAAATTLRLDRSQQTLDHARKKQG